MDLLTIASLVSICKSTRSKWRNVQWLTVFSAIGLWCRSHGLNLNADKSDVIWLGTTHQLSKISQADNGLHLLSGILRASETARNLGVIIDQHLTFDMHAHACSRACFYHLHRIRQIRQFVDNCLCGYCSTRLSCCV